jgi:hypothetical protein
MIFNYALSIILGIGSIPTMFYLSANDTQMIGGFFMFLVSIIFFLFGLVEEKSIEIMDLKKITKQK